MNKNWRFVLLICLLLTLPAANLFAQTSDTTIVLSETEASGAPIKKDRTPRKAAIRSAIIPGWGQAYNRRYWKVPIIYALGGTIGYFYVDNTKTFKKNRDLLAADPNGPNAEIYRLNRDQFREWRDWNIFMFVALYVVNILDANVDAHLREFDVGENLSFNVKPYLYRDFYNSPVTGLSVNLKLKK